MFRIVAVDDERIEIEAMIKLVPWDNADAVLVGTAYDGIDGLERIEETNPDIVITDIKMPRMDGIRMIEKALEKHPNLIFIVLSGYGEYEYTSQAMELGIKHYILKPINEDKILETLRKAEDEVRLIEKAEKEKRNKDNAIKELEPSARRDFFSRALKGFISDEEARFYKANTTGYGLFAFMIAGNTGEEAEKEFLSAANEILGDKVLFSAEIKEIFYFMINQPELELLENDALIIRRYILSEGFRDIRFAFSDNQNLAEARRNIEILLSASWNGGKLIQSDGKISTKEMNRLIRKEGWNNIRNTIDLYRYAASFDLMMQGAEYTDKMRKAAISSFCIMTGAENDDESDREAIFRITEKAFLKNTKETDEEKRKREIIRAVFINLPSIELNITLIANETAYMNEDYFSRYFQKNTGIKFSRFVTNERMKCAEEVISFVPAISLQKLATLSGYQEDGQYFQKVFKETFGITINTCRGRYFSRDN